MKQQCYVLHTTYIRYFFTKNYLSLLLAGLAFLGYTSPLMAQQPDVIINEINYDYNENFKGYKSGDWVELYNTTTNPVDLSNWILADGDTIFTIPLGVSIMPDDYYVFAKDALDFSYTHPSVLNLLQSDLSFSENGETITLFDNAMMVVDSVAFGDDAPWPEEPDGNGPTLSLSDPSLDNDLPQSWESSGNYAGTPGRANQVYCTGTPPEIVINEINYKSVVLIDPKDWVELHNPTNAAVDVSFWEFVDKKEYYRIPSGTVIPAGGFLVLTQTKTAFQSFFPGVPTVGDFVFGLSGGGEDIGLFTNERCPVDKVDYNDDLPWPVGTDSTGNTLALVDPSYNNNLPASWANSQAGGGFFGTPGAANNIPDPCNPNPGDIIINEINYNSNSDFTPGNWVELYNSGSSTVDLSNWEFHDPDTAFVVPVGTTIAAGDYLVIAEDSMRFAAAFPTVTNYIGSMNFGLSNKGERLLLYGTDDSQNFAYCMIDSIRYRDDGVWPTGPDGGGPSLSLVDATTDNVLGENWASSTGNGTPGAANTFSIDPQLFVWIQGAYDTAALAMTTTLNIERSVLPGQTPSNPLVAPTPPGQPYNDIPWNYTGTEGVSWPDSAYSATVVDWILVSFRTDIAKSTEVGIGAALLHNDGEVELVNGSTLADTGADSLYVVIEHRNHIAVMTPDKIPVNNYRMSYDFRIADSYKDQTSFGQLEVLPGVWGMIAGDGSQENDIQSYDVGGQDKIIWETLNGIFDQYLPADYNLDGEVNGGDKSVWSPNNGLSSRVPR